MTSTDGLWAGLREMHNEFWRLRKQIEHDQRQRMIEKNRRIDAIEYSPRKKTKLVDIVGAITTNDDREPQVYTLTEEDVKSEPMEDTAMSSGVDNIPLSKFSFKVVDEKNVILPKAQAEKPENKNKPPTDTTTPTSIDLKKVDDVGKAPALILEYEKKPQEKIEEDVASVVVKTDVEKEIYPIEKDMMKVEERTVIVDKDVLVIDDEDVKNVLEDVCDNVAGAMKKKVEEQQEDDFEEVEPKQSSQNLVNASPTRLSEDGGESELKLWTPPKKTKSASEEEKKSTRAGNGDGRPQGNNLEKEFVTKPIKVGRKLKILNLAVDVPSTSSTPSEPVIKRKRGRPRKDAPKLSPVPKVEANAAETKVRRNSNFAGNVPNYDEEAKVRKNSSFSGNTPTSSEIKRASTYPKRLRKKRILIDESTTSESDDVEETVDSNSKEGAIECEYDGCGKRFSSKWDFDRHYNIHIGKRFKCDQCEKSFSQEEYLADHQRIHKGESDYQCNVCGIKFVRHGQYVRHMNKEKGTYKCDFENCGKVFGKLSHLKNHKSVHNGDIFKCDECGKAFTQRGNLQQHVRTHREADAFTCQFCNRKFEWIRSLVLHVPKCPKNIQYLI